MAGLRIENPQLAKDVSPQSLVVHAGAAKKRFPELAQFIDQLQNTINGLVVSLQKYRIGELSLVKLLSATGRQIGWFGVNGNADGVALQTLRAYEDGAQIGTGLHTLNATITAAGTETLIVGSSNQVQQFSFDAGVGTYTYNIDLSYSGAFEGSTFILMILKTASTNPTIVIRDGAGGGGGNFASINNGIVANYVATFVFNGSNWVRMLLVRNDVV